MYCIIELNINPKTFSMKQQNISHFKTELIEINIAFGYKD